MQAGLRPDTAMAHMWISPVSFMRAIVVYYMPVILRPEKTLQLLQHMNERQKQLLADNSCLLAKKKNRKLLTPMVKTRDVFWSENTEDHQNMRISILRIRINQDEAARFNFLHMKMHESRNWLQKTCGVLFQPYLRQRRWILTSFLDKSVTWIPLPILIPFWPLTSFLYQLKIALITMIIFDTRINISKHFQ